MKPFCNVFLCVIDRASQQVLLGAKKSLKNFKKLYKKCKKTLDKNAKIDYYIQALV